MKGLQKINRFQFGKTPERSTSIDFEIELVLSEFLKGRSDFDIKFNYMRDRERLKGELLQHIHDRVLPRVFEKTGVRVSDRHPSRTSSDIHSDHASRSTTEAGNVAVSSRISLQLLLTSDSAIHPVQAMYNVRGAVAAFLAQAVLDHLDKSKIGFGMPFENF